MKKYISSKIRDTERVYKCEPVVAWVKKKARDCQLALIRNSSSDFELAIFLYKPSRMFMINNKMELLVVMPITKECNMYLREKGFAFRWLDFPDTQWEIKTSNGQLIDELQKHHQEASIYQREPFTAGSPTHQWLWYYEEAIPSQIRIVTSRSAKVFVHRESLNLLPQHYGKGPMQGYINEQLNKLQHEYLVFSNISLFIGTWNCAGTCPSKNIIDWFNRTTEEYDIIVINLQEVCELTTMNILANENGQDVWLHFLINQVRIAFPSTQYEIKISQHLVGLLSVVFVNSKISQNLKNTSGLIVKLGLRGYTGNKGAICMRFDYLDTSLCIVNCHLAAHKSKISNRNEHIKSILKQTVFSIKGKDLKIYEHDLIFWAGDLNYRIQSLDSCIIDEILTRKDLTTLLKYDQLNLERNKGSVLVDFKEAQINFPPTFKYKPESNEYSTKREPAWCDRILWRGEATCLTYNSCETLRQSDHRPVYSIFQATVKLIQLDKKRSLKAEIVKQLETQRQEYLPKVKVSPLEFEFSNVLYKVQQEKTLFIMNIGKTVCVFNILYDKVFTWLSFSQLTGSIHPGETLEIQIKVLFKEKEAQKANYICKYRTASPKLRFIDGIEENLMVRSDFAGSCFGCNFKELAKILGPISNLKGNIKENADKTEGITTVPKELFRIVEFIKASEVSGELERLCDFDTIAEIRSNLDCFEPFSNKANWNAMVLVLIEMLEAMPSPLISPIIFDEIIKETPIGPGSLLRAAIYAKVDLITLKSFEYLMDLLKWLCEKNHKLLEFITENFMYSIFHIKRTKNSTVITDYTRRQFFINMVIS